MEPGMESMSMVPVSAGSAWASMAAGRPCQQISSENGRPLAGMNPWGMSARNANATSKAPAISVRLLRFTGTTPVSHWVQASVSYQQMWSP